MLSLRVPSRLPTTRIAASLVLAPVVVAAILAGGPWFIALVFVAATLLAREWHRMSGGAQPKAPRLLLVAPLWIALGFGAAGMPGAAVAVLAAGTLAVAVASDGSPWLSGGVLYLGLPGLALIWLRTAFPDGQQIVLWLFLVVWASDIGAYVSGRLLGGPRLAPRISPNKTWAGVGGGLALACACGFAFARLAAVSDPALTIMASIGLSIVAQLGDLAESGMKRHFGIKDAGSLIPGHGGLFDRLDSLLPGAVATAAFVLLGKVPV